MEEEWLCWAPCKARTPVNAVTSPGEAEVGCGSGGSSKGLWAGMSPACVAAWKLAAFVSSGVIEWFCLPAAFNVLVLSSASSNNGSVAPGIVLEKDELSGPAPKDETPRPCHTWLREDWCMPRVLCQGWPVLTVSLYWRWFLAECAPKKEIQTWSPGEISVEAERLPPPYIQYSSENTQ